MCRARNLPHQDEAAGFVFVAQIDDFSNLNDDHMRSIFQETAPVTR
jgi:hypothetical protein